MDLVDLFSRTLFRIERKKERRFRARPNKVIHPLEKKLYEDSLKRMNRSQLYGTW